MKLINHLDPSQSRLGYLSCLALVAGRQLDTRQGLVDRFCRFIFQPIDAHDSRWSEFMELADKTELERIKPQVDEKLAELSELFRVKSVAGPSYTLHSLWLAQRRLTSHVGHLAKKDAVRIIEMARSFEILTTGYALSEKGVFLQNFASYVFPGAIDGSPRCNPFAITQRLGLQLFFLYALLSVDVLTPFLLQAFAESSEGDLLNAPTLLGLGADALVAAVERITDVSSIDAIRESRSFAERTANKSIARNQARPRYHQLFELQLLDRVEADASGNRTVPYVANDACRRAAGVLSPLRDRPDEQQDLIDRQFFSWSATIFGRTAQPCVDDTLRLLYFARGYEHLQREIGFTPGRTIALAGCLLALEEGWIIEVAEMFDLMRRMAAGPWRPYLEYSGGSRLDQEFLIKIKPSLIPALEDALSRETAPGSGEANQ
jgi:hypothetical protein